MSEDLEDILKKAASENAMLARVRRHVEGRPVEPRAEDFYAALKYDPAVVVRLSGEMPGEREIPIDCRFRNGAVEFTTEFRDITVTGRDQFLEDVREAVEIEVRHHRDSQFAEAWTCPSCGGESTDPDSRVIDHANEVRVTCPQCGAVDYIPQGTEPARPREEVSS